MTWATFFKPRPVAYGAFVGTTGVILGVIATTLLSLKSASYCSSMVDYVGSNLEEDINIPKVTANWQFKNYSTTITLTNLSANIPTNWIDMIKHVISKAPSYCFYLPFVFGLIATMVLSLSATAIVMVTLHINALKEKPLETEEYSLLEGPNAMNPI